MDREKIKLKEKEFSNEELIGIIKEKEIEVNEYKTKLQLAEQEIDSIKKELDNLRQTLNNSINFELGTENKISAEETKESIPTLVLGECSMEVEKTTDSFEDKKLEEIYKFFGDIEPEPNNEEINEGKNNRIDGQDETKIVEKVSEEINEIKNNIDILGKVSEEFNEYIEPASDEVNQSETKDTDIDKLEDVCDKDNLIESNDESLDKNNLMESNDESLDKNSELFENLKVAFIDNNNSQCIKFINDILDNINSMENNFTYEESITLIYLSYFYDKLEELLNKSKVINDCYLSETDEIKLLRKILQEKEYPIYKEVRECLYIEIKNNKNLFKTVDTIIKVRVIDKINSILYKNFEFVYSINDIEYGEETTCIKAWVKEKNGFMWRLVEGLYSQKKEKLYMLDSSIYVLKLNINESIKEESKSEKNYNDFFRKSSIKESTIVTKEDDESENIIKDKETIDEEKQIINEEINKEKQISDTMVNKKIILEDDNEEVKSNHNKWFNFKEKIASKLKKDNK